MQICVFGAENPSWKRKIAKIRRIFKANLILIKIKSSSSTLYRSDFSPAQTYPSVRSCSTTEWVTVASALASWKFFFSFILIGNFFFSLTRSCAQYSFRNKTFNESIISISTLIIVTTTLSVVNQKLKSQSSSHHPKPPTPRGIGYERKSSQSGWKKMSNCAYKITHLENSFSLHPEKGRSKRSTAQKKEVNK